MRNRSFVFLLVFVFAISALGAAQRYTITDLGPLTPTAINSWAQVAGNYNNQACIWTLGRMRSLGTLPGGTFSQATSINDLGVVVGNADGQGTVVSLDPDWPTQQCSDLVQPFVWTPQQMQGLGRVGPASDVEYIEPGSACNFPFYSTAINGKGQVVGYTSKLSDAYAWAFIWTKKNGMRLFGGTSFPAIFATAISNTGEIVGISSSSAAYWVNNIETYLPGLPPSPEYDISGANDTNDVGQIVGWSKTQTNCASDYISCFHAVRWSNGTINDLGTLPGDVDSSATKINLFGIIIGSSGNTFAAALIYDQELPQVVGRPFVWTQQTGIRDLNTVIPQNSGWVLQSAADINVWGQIVGQGTRNGMPHGYMLTPLNPFQVF